MVSILSIVSILSKKMRILRGIAIVKLKGWIKRTLNGSILYTYKIEVISSQQLANIYDEKLQLLQEDSVKLSTHKQHDLARTLVSKAFQTASRKNIMLPQANENQLRSF